MTREEAIEILEKHHMWTGEPQELIEVRKENKALDMAIASLKTDEAYQLEYENRDFVEIPEGMTNGEVVQTLFPNADYYSGAFFMHIKDEMSNEIYVRQRWWNTPYQKGAKYE